MLNTLRDMDAASALSSAAASTSATTRGGGRGGGAKGTKKGAKKGKAAAAAARPHPLDLKYEQLKCDLTVMDEVRSTARKALLVGTLFVPPF